jgi:hypothetical protein
MSTPGFEETPKTLKRGREENREERKKKTTKTWLKFYPKSCGNGNPIFIFVVLRL